ncbi:ABC-three component system protein [Pseudoclavibacter sp. Z016]|uniref:ABC-three component system protein n=1 Tax=Pseudoclavibacter sp. Z016 TaxID=2080581 RepID=UPI0021572AC6|nr:ABC-three component system protein [Pseudoclavibacter sp. Z016]
MPLVQATGQATVPEWVAAIGRDLFGFPDEHTGISARALLGLYIRRVSQHGMDDAVQTFPRQSAAEATANIAYLLGLDWRLAASYQQLASRESLRRKLKSAAKDPAFGLVVGTVSELRGQVAAHTVRVRRLEEQVAAFRVVPEYELLQARADEADARIRRTRAEDAADRRNLQDLQDALRDEHEPDTHYLVRAYRELGIVLPDAVLRRYEDVQSFHESVLTNRRVYLEEEIASTEARLEGRQAERQQLGEEQAGLLRALHEGGALDAFTALQDQLSRARSDLQTISTRFETAKQLEATQAEIKFERSRLQQEISRDLIEREQHIAEINILFQRFATALYGPGRDAYVEIAALDTSLRISPHIGGENSQGIGKMVIFCFDLTCAVLAHRSGRGPDFLVHDSHLFDGVDERQVAEALKLVANVAEEEGLQYIVTMNSDDLTKAEQYDDGLSADVIKPRLTDAFDDGGLFGFHFE